MLRFDRKQQNSIKQLSFQKINFKIKGTKLRVRNGVLIFGDMNTNMIQYSLNTYDLAGFVLGRYNNNKSSKFWLTLKDVLGPVRNTSYQLTESSPKSLRGQYHAQRQEQINVKGRLGPETGDSGYELYKATTKVQKAEGQLLEES